MYYGIIASRFYSTHIINVSKTKYCFIYCRAFRRICQHSATYGLTFVLTNISASKKTCSTQRFQRITEHQIIQLVNIEQNFRPLEKFEEFLPHRLIKIYASPFIFRFYRNGEAGDLSRLILSLGPVILLLIYFGYNVVRSSIHHADRTRLQFRRFPMIYKSFYHYYVPVLTPRRYPNKFDELTCAVYRNLIYKRLLPTWPTSCKLTWARYLWEIC